MSSTFIILLVLGLVNLQQILCQDDAMDSRAGQKIISDGSGGGQSRQLHSQKHFSPHRMMHFGKRPLVPLPPVLPPQAPQQTIADNLEMLSSGQQQKRLTLVDEEQQRLVQQAVNEYLPYSLMYDVPGEQMLEAAPADHLRDKHLMDIVDHLLQFSKQQQACNTNTNNNNKRQESSNNNNNNLQQQQELPAKMMKLINGEADNSYELAATLDKLQQEQKQQQQQQQAEQINEQQAANSEQQDAINVVGRSVARSRAAGEPFDLTKAHISSLLFGRRITEPPSSLMSLGGFIKKAEPQRMTFMHFG